MKLKNLELWLQQPQGDLLAAIRPALVAHGVPLRWAITAVDTRQQRLLVEAVVIQA